MQLSLQILCRSRTFWDFNSDVQESVKMNLKSYNSSKIKVLIFEAVCFLYSKVFQEFYNIFEMKLKYVLAMLLLVATLCNLTTDDGTSPEAEVSSTLRTNVNKALANLQNFGSGSASLSLIKFYLTNINKCLDDVLSLHNINVGQAATSNDVLVIANKELSTLTQDSTQMDLDFLVMTTPTSLIRQLLLGAYQINLSNVEAITKDPDSVIQKLTDTDAFQAAKNLFLNTPQANRILC